jgi:hypothetical protein
MKTAKKKKRRRPHKAADALARAVLSDLKQFEKDLRAGIRLESKYKVRTFIQG